MRKPNILVTICARGGSKGVKNKNVRLLNRKPLIAYTILQALRWGKATKVVVSTDSHNIASVSEKFGADVPFIRPKVLAGDHSPKFPVIRHALQSSEEIYKEKFDIIVDLQPTSPVRTTKDLDSALSLFSEKKLSCLFSVVPSSSNPYFNMVERSSSGKITVSKSVNRPITRRQDAPPVFEMNGSIYLFSREHVLNPDSISPVSANSDIYIMNQWASVDIDRELDFKFLEYLIENKIVSI